MFIRCHANVSPNDASLGLYIHYVRVPWTMRSLDDASLTDVFRSPGTHTGVGLLSETWVNAGTRGKLCSPNPIMDHTKNSQPPASIVPPSVRDGSYKDASSEGRIVQGSHRFSRMMWSKHVWRLQAIIFNVNGCLNLPSTACFMMNRTFHLKLKSYAVNFIVYVE
jgi:hypothetical protein